MQHNLKTLPKWYKDVVSGAKTFEVRRKDRNFKVGDTLSCRSGVRRQGIAAMPPKSMSFIFLMISNI